MITIDEARGLITVDGPDGVITHSMASPEGFKIVSDAWVRCGWDAKYVYSFTWMGRPIIQLPDDMVRIQELIYQLKPDLIIETGVAHGGSLIYSPSLCTLLKKGRIVGVDIEIRPHNRTAIEAHEMAPLITLIEGSSTDPAIVEQVRGHIRPGDTVLVILDSNHTKPHVLGELEAYGPMVSPGSYIIATDGITSRMVGAPRSQPDWVWNNPVEAAKDYVKAHPEFIHDEPAFPFNEGVVQDRVTYWVSGYLKRV
jgi:cephalosporin hydroxylase